MCRSKFSGLKKNEQGYILIVVLAILVLLTLLIYTTYLSAESALKETSLESDRRYAQSLVEATTAIAAQEISHLFSNPQNKIIPPAGSYDEGRVQGGVLLAQLSEGGPLLKMFDESNWPQYFRINCDGIKGKLKGLCSTSILSNDRVTKKPIYPPPPVYDRPNVFNEYGGKKQCGNAFTIDQKTLPNEAVREPCYVVEFMGIDFHTRTLRFRITAIAWGRHPKTSVKMQTTYEMDYD